MPTHPFGCQRASDPCGGRRHFNVVCHSLSFLQVANEWPQPIVNIRSFARRKTSNLIGTSD
jgi:hypothetical protein